MLQNILKNAKAIVKCLFWESVPREIVNNFPYEGSESAASILLEISKKLNQNLKEDSGTPRIEIEVDPRQKRYSLKDKAEFIVYML